MSGGKKKKLLNGTSTKKHDEQKYLLSEHGSFSLREAYNVLRTNVIFSIPVEGCKAIGITSSERADGKSTNIMNLAICFAETKSRVLLVDCDLRKPKIARFLDMEQSPGISNVIVGLCSIYDAIRKSKYENLDTLLSGDIPPNPTELLNSQKFGEIMQELSTQYDYILVDTPPVNVVADASIISKHLMGFVFVVCQGMSERNSVTSAIEQLKFVNAKILGFLLNKVTHNKSRRRKYKKYGYYGYEYEYSDSENKQPENSGGMSG